MTMTKIRQKYLPYILAALGTVAFVALVYVSSTYMDMQRSRQEARELALGFTEKMAQFAADENLRYDELSARVSQASAKAMVLKAEKLEELELLTLVNPWNPLPEGYVPKLEAINDMQAVDYRCADDLRHMVLDCYMAGGAPYICSSYRTQEMQQALYDNKVARVIGQGYSAEAAPAIAAQSVAIPGTSEHQLGLAVDIIDKYFTDLTYMQEYTYTQQWLIENSWKYGFILRYPNGTTEITGIIYEPWHYRYVGKEVAEEIHQLGITFEEYLPLRRGR